MSVPDEFRRQNLREKHVKQLVKTEMCKFFFLNKCVKGPSCPYAHSVSEIREKPDLGKTSMCPDFLATGNCTSLGCRFAHDERDLRTTSGFFKTKMCSFASSGRCKYGAACRFAHRPSEIHAIWPPSPGAVNPPLPLRPSGRDPAPPGPAAHGDGRASPPGRAGKAGDADQGAGRDVSSDQSTRDATSASRGGSVCASTPEGSGDSVQDGMSVRGVRRRRGQAAPARQCTTLVISNVPSFLTQGAVVSLLEDLTECMRGAFDFFYCPWNPNQDRNLGYAIINFFSRSAAAEFERRWANEPLLPGTLGAKKVKLVPAALQGRAANLRHFSGFSLAHHHDPRFRPLVRAAPDQVLRPMALPEEIQQGHASDSGHYPLEQRGLLEHGDLEEQGGVVDPCQELNLQSHAGERLRPSSCRTESQAMPSQERWGSSGSRPALDREQHLDLGFQPPSRVATGPGLFGDRLGFGAPLEASSMDYSGREPYQGLYREGPGPCFHAPWAQDVPSMERWGSTQRMSPPPVVTMLPSGGIAEGRRPLPLRADVSYPGSLYPCAVPEAAEDADEVYSD